MKVVVAASLIGVTACGQANENMTGIAPESTRSGQNPKQSEGEAQLGVVAGKATWSGSYAAVLNPVTKAAPAGALQAFGSVTTFVDTVSQNKCAGAFASEPDPLKPTTHVNVYFYTATHCFEKVNSIGATTLPVRTSVLPANAATQKTIGDAVTFAPPFASVNKLAKTVHMSSPQIQYEGTIRTDVIRFLQGNFAINSPSAAVLPTCPAAKNVPSNIALAAGVMAFDGTGIVHANGKDRKSVRAGNIIDAKLMWIADSGLGTLLELDQVGTIPGESGSPVWLIDGDRDVNTTKAYLCLQGVVSREMLVPELQTNGTYEFKLRSYFTPILPVGGAIRWVQVK